MVEKPNPPYTGREMIARLTALWPEVFTPEKPRPLKVGIHCDLMKASTGLSNRQVIAALYFYTKASAYLRGLATGRARIGLSGAAEGTVTKSDTECAIRELKELRQSKQVSHRKPAQRPPAPPKQSVRTTRQITVVVLKKKRKLFR